MRAASRVGPESRRAGRAGRVAVEVGVGGRRQGEEKEGQTQAPGRGRGGWGWAGWGGVNQEHRSSLGSLKARESIPVSLKARCVGRGSRQTLTIQKEVLIHSMQRETLVKTQYFCQNQGSVHVFKIGSETNDSIMCLFSAGHYSNTSERVCSIHGSWVVAERARCHTHTHTHTHARTGTSSGQDACQNSGCVRFHTTRSFLRDRALRSQSRAEQVERAHLLARAWLRDICPKVRATHQELHAPVARTQTGLSARLPSD